MMHSVDTEFLKAFRAKIEERQLELIKGLGAGSGINDFSEYRHRVGQMKALNFALIAAVDINDTLMGVSRNKVA